MTTAIEKIVCCSQSPKGGGHTALLRATPESIRVSQEAEGNVAREFIVVSGGKSG